MPCEILIKKMFSKSTIAAAAASPFLFAGAAFAGPYVNMKQMVHTLTGHTHLAISNYRLDMKEQLQMASTGMLL